MLKLTAKHAVIKRIKRVKIMNNIIKLVIKAKVDLSVSYIQQFKYGGIFIGGEFNYTIDDEVFLIISLPDGGAALAVAGVVKWLSPVAALAYPPGIGVQFSSDQVGSEAKSRIESILAGVVDEETNSYTF